MDASLAARSSLTADDIEHLGRSDLGAILPILPGLNVRSGGRAEPRLDLRGFDQRATLVTLDGVPVYEPYNGIVSLSLFPTEILSGVEVMRGATSSLYGASGMAGAVHLTTPQATAARGRASTTWRDANFWDARASAMGSVGAAAVLAGGRYLDSGGFPLADDFRERPESLRRFDSGGRRRNSDRNEWSAFARGSYSLSETASVRAAMLESSAAYGIPPRTTSFTPQIRRMEQQRLRHVQLVGEQRAWRGNDIGLVLFYSGHDSREDERNPERTSEVIGRIAVDAYEVGARASGHRELRGGSTVALALVSRHARADVADSVTVTRSSPEVTLTSAAIEGRQEFWQRWALIAGMSVDLQAGGGRGSEWQGSPQAGVTLDHGRWGRSRASASRKVRFPTLRELFDPIQGNPDLSAERSWIYEIGHELPLWIGGPNIGGTLYRADVDDLIESSGGRSGDPAPARNLTEAVLQGFELVGDWQPVEAVLLRSNYTYIDARAENPRSAERGARAEIQHRPRHRVNAVVDLHLPWEVGARFEARWVSEQVDRFGTSVRLDAYTLLHAEIRKGLFDGRLQVAAGAENLLDEDYEEALGMPQPGRWVYVALRGASW